MRAGLSSLRMSEEQELNVSEFDPEADAAAIVRRARKLCKRHRIGAAVGCCRECVLRAIEEHISEAHPEMKRGNVFDLVQEWLLKAGEPSHRAPIR